MGTQDMGFQIGFLAACPKTGQILVVVHHGYQNSVDGSGLGGPACQSLGVGCYRVAALRGDFVLVQNLVVALAVQLALEVVVL